MGFVLDAYAARSCPLKTVYRFTPGLEPPRDRLPDPPFFHDADAIEASVMEMLGKEINLAPQVDWWANREWKVSDWRRAFLRGVKRFSEVFHRDTDVVLLADLIRTREEFKGPDGFPTWKDAAVDERRRRVEAERQVKALQTDLQTAQDRLKVVEEDSERLDFIAEKAQKSRTGISFEFGHFAGETAVGKVFRAMWFHTIGSNTKKDLRSCIDDAMTK